MANFTLLLYSVVQYPAYYPSLKQFVIYNYNKLRLQSPSHIDMTPNFFILQYLISFLPFEKRGIRECFLDNYFLLNRDKFNLVDFSLMHRYIFLLSLNHHVITILVYILNSSPL